MTPESVGVSKTSLVLGKLSGRHAFKDKLEAMGYELGANALEEAFRKFKDLADKKKHVFDEDIAALVDDEIARGQDRIQFVNLRVVAGTFGPQSAELELSVDGETKLGVARGDGPVDAIFNAIKMLFPHNAQLIIFEVHAVTEGTDAQAGVTVRLAEDGRSVTARGSDTDTLVAAAKAYVHALNKLLVKRTKAAPEPMLALRGV
jgi:2-isopropylmalate synthase